LAFAGLQGCSAAPTDEKDTSGNAEPASVEDGLETKLPCCPQGWDLYGCQSSPEGPTFLYCHNPKLACPSKCGGGGCDFRVSGTCPATS